MIQHARIGHNHVAALGNPKVKAAAGVVHQYKHLQHACRDQDLSLACFIICSQQYLFYDGTGKFPGQSSLEVQTRLLPTFICRQTMSQKAPKPLFMSVFVTHKTNHAINLICCMTRRT